MPKEKFVSWIGLDWFVVIICFTLLFTVIVGHGGMLFTYALSSDIA